MEPGGRIVAFGFRINQSKRIEMKVQREIDQYDNYNLVHSQSLFFTFFSTRT